MLQSGRKLVLVFRSSEKLGSWISKQCTNLLGRRNVKTVDSVLAMSWLPLITLSQACSKKELQGEQKVRVKVVKKKKKKWKEGNGCKKKSRVVDKKGVEKVAVIVKEINTIKENWPAVLGDNRKCALKAVSPWSASP